MLRQVAGGATNKEIAADLGVAVSTVERHLVNLYTKIGARGRADAIAYALRSSSARSLHLRLARRRRLQTKLPASSELPCPCTSRPADTDTTAWYAFHRLRADGLRTMRSGALPRSTHSSMTERRSICDAPSPPPQCCTPGAMKRRI